MLVPVIPKSTKPFWCVHADYQGTEPHCSIMHSLLTHLMLLYRRLLTRGQKMSATQTEKQRSTAKLLLDLLHGPQVGRYLEKTPGRLKESKDVSWKWNVALVGKLLSYLLENRCQCTLWYPQEWAPPILLSGSGLLSHPHQTRPGEPKVGGKEKEKDDMFREKD